MHIGGDQHFYETRLKQEHAHIICLRCGKVEEFFGEPLPSFASRSNSISDLKSCWPARKSAAIVRTVRLFESRR